MNGDMQTQVAEAARQLVASRYAIALVGAGISVESGIRPFRGKGGLWTEKGEPPMDGYQRFMRDPAGGWAEMLARRGADDEFSHSLAAAQPNPAHHAMARLETLGVLRHTITQNIDDLHFRAGSVAVTEIHGNRTKVRCVDCGARWPWDEFIAIAVETPSPQPEGQVEYAEINGLKLPMPPECPQCAGIVKSDTVMFGERIPQAFLMECLDHTEKADACLIAGTSANVTPAADFAVYVLQQGGAIVEVNTEDTPFTPYAAAVLRGPAGEMLPALVEKVEALLAERGGRS